MALYIVWLLNINSRTFVLRWSTEHWQRHDQLTSESHYKRSAFFQISLSWPSSGNSWWEDTESICISECKYFIFRMIYFRIIDFLQASLSIKHGRYPLLVFIKNCMSTSISKNYNLKNVFIQVVICGAKMSWVTLFLFYCHSNTSIGISTKV